MKHAQSWAQTRPLPKADVISLASHCDFAWGFVAEPCTYKCAVRDFYVQTHDQSILISLGDQAPPIAAIRLDSLLGNADQARSRQWTASDLPSNQWPSPVVHALDDNHRFLPNWIYPH